MALVPEPARALEMLLAKRRSLSAALLSLDAEDRWGAHDAAAQASVAARSAKAEAEQSANDAALKALAERVRGEEPDAFRRWAEAHIELLDAYVAELGDDAAKRTERFVALGERAQWVEVIAGARLFVEENTYYVNVDRALYETLFALAPE